VRERPVDPPCGGPFFFLRLGQGGTPIESGMGVLPKRVRERRAYGRSVTGLESPASGAHSRLEVKTVESSSGSAGRQRQAEVYLAGLRGALPEKPVSFQALEERARSAISSEAFAYVAGRAGLESTTAANREAFDQVRIVPPVLRDVAARDTGIELFSRRLPAPLLLAPIGVLEMAHRDADLALAGEHGLREVIRNFRAEFDITMGVAGCRSVAEIRTDRLGREG